jgi:hypothetical protein
MFYKASDASTSTRDWFSLSFSTVPWALLAGREISEEIGEEPEEPDEDDFEGDEKAFAEAGAKYEEAYEAWREREENQGGEPAWSYVFASDHARRAFDEAVACGLRVMTDDDLGTFYAIDSGGHSFFGAYWIPLRARIAAHQIESNEAADNIALCAMLAREYNREGEGGKDPCAAIGELLEISEPTIRAARALYEEKATGVVTHDAAIAALTSQIQRIYDAAAGYENADPDDMAKQLMLIASIAEEKAK